MSLDDSFAKLLGRQPTDTERQQLYRVRDALGLKNNDALWLVLMALQHHQTQFDEVPERIEGAVNSILNNARKTAEAEILKTSSKIHGELVTSVAETAKQVARATSGKSMSQWVIGAVCASLFVLCLALVAGYQIGSSSATNRSAAANAWMTTAGGQKALAAYQYDAERAEWAGTRDARDAFLMSKSGELRRLAECSKDGWKTEKRSGITYCFPTRDKDNNVTGWQIP